MLYIDARLRRLMSIKLVNFSDLQKLTNFDHKSDKTSVLNDMTILMKSLFWQVFQLIDDLKSIYTDSQKQIVRLLERP